MRKTIHTKKNKLLFGNLVKVAMICCVLIMGLTHSGQAQNSLIWNYYTNGQQVNSATEYNGTFWVATNGGLVKMDQSGQKIFYNSGNSGLPTNDILAVATDTNGNKWIGTNGGGLVKYDGSNWTVYNSANSVLPTDVIKDITVDSNGIVWAASYDKDGTKGGIIKIDNNNISLILLGASGYNPGNSVTSLSFNNSNNVLWAGTNGNGLMKMDGQTHTFYTSDNSGLPANNEIIDVKTASDGSVWVVTDLGDLAHFDGTNWTDYNTSNSNLSSDPQSVNIDSNGNIWVGTKTGLSEFDGSSFVDHGSKGSIRSLFIDGNDNIWAGTNSNNLDEYNGSTWSHYETSNSGLPKGISIGKIYYDSNGGLWITSSSSDIGVIVYDGTTWKTFNSTNSGLQRNDISQVVEDRDGNIWAASSYGISVYDGANWTKKNDYLNLNIYDSAINDMAVDTSNNIWIAPGNSGLIKYNGSSWKQYDMSNTPLPVNNITAIYADSNGTMWFAYNDDSYGSTGSGLAKYDGTNWTIYKAKDYNLVDFHITDITSDNNGTLWLANYYHGIDSFDGTNFKEYNRNNSALVGDRVQNLSFDSSGNLWVVFNDYIPSIAKFDGKKFHVFSSVNSKLTNSFPTHMVIDSNDVKWIGNERGELIKLQGGSDPIANFTADIHRGYAPLTVNFSDLTNSKVSKRQWTFQGGDPSSSTDANPSVTYNSTGTYDVTLKVTNADGSTSYTKAGYITVLDAHSSVTSNWMNYTNGSIINDIIQQGQVLWLATNGGLTKYDTSTGMNTYFTRANSKLPTNHINKLATDSKGQLWIGTKEGLAKYDGSEWKVYNSSNSSLPANNITALAVDKNDKIWLGTISSQAYSTSNQGLISYDGTSFNIETSNIPSGAQINTITFDDKNNVWVGTDGKGLAEYDGSTVTTFNTTNSSIPNDNVNAIAFDTNGTVWVGTYAGLADYDGSTWTEHDQVEQSITFKISANDLKFDSKGNLWIGTLSFGLKRFDGTNFTTYDKDNSKLASNDVKSLLVDSNGEVWTGTTNSVLTSESTNKSTLVEYDGLNWKAHNTSNSGLPSNSISRISFDQHGNAWMNVDSQLGLFSGNSASGGLVMFNGSTWSVFDKNNSGILSGDITGITIDGDGDIWAGTKNGLSEYDGVHWLTYGKTEMGTQNEAVTDITTDNMGNIWAAIQGTGIVMYNGSKWNIYKPGSSFSVTSLGNIIVSKDGTVWVGTLNNGLYSFDGSSWTVYNSSNTSLGDMINALTIDKQGNLWVASNSGLSSMLSKFDGSSWTDITLPQNTGEINDITEDANGVLWFAFSGGFAKTSGTLAYYDGSKFTILDHNNSRLSSSDISTVSFDSHGRAWIGTSGGGVFIYNGGGNLPTDVQHDKSLVRNLPTKVELKQNYPNPFNPTTQIKYALPNSMMVHLTVYNILGRKVAELVNNRQSAGIHVITFDASHLASGVYFYRIRTNAAVQTKKMLLIK